LVEAISAHFINGLCVVVSKRHRVHQRPTEEGTLTMKVVITALAMAVTLATPALSQTADRPTQSNQLRASDPYVSGRQSQGYSNESANRVREQRSTNSRNDVFSLRGEYVGSDPDPTVREQLSRDPSQGD
jgi:hypothetical protein